MTNYSRFFIGFLGAAFFLGCDLPPGVAPTPTPSPEPTLPAAATPSPTAKPLPTATPSAFPTSSPVPSPMTEAPPLSIVNGSVSALSNASLAFTFLNPSNAAVEIDRRDTNGNQKWVTLVDLPEGTTSYKDLGLHSPWRYDYQFIAHRGTSEAAPFQLINLLLLADGTLQWSGHPAPTNAPTATPAPTPTPAGGRPVLPPVPGNAVNVPSGSNLQNAINGAQAGTKLVLSGSYAVNNLTLKSGVNLAGAASIHGDLKGSRLSNVRLDGLTINGTLVLDDSASNVWLTNNVFDSGHKANDLVFHGGNDVHVVNNTFQNASDIALLGWVMKNTEVNYNLFQNSSEHLHLFWAESGPNNPDNVKINHNIFRRSKRYTMELQGGPNTVEVAHNWVGDWINDDIRNNCLSTTMSIATGGGSPGGTSYHVKIHDNIVGYFPANPPLGSGCGSTGSAYELMGSDLEGWNNLEFGFWKGGPLTGWTTPAWKWHDNIKIGSGLSSYPNPAGEDHYQAPAPGNYVNNKVVPDGAIPFPSMDWAYTNK